jgi:flavodoxin
METLVVYDSVHGNTERVARAIGEAIPGEVAVLRAEDVDLTAIKTFELVIGGAPPHGGPPPPPVVEFLEGLTGPGLERIKFAAFDTRVPARWVRIFGYAAPRIARALQKQGARFIGPPAGFFVQGTEGPLLQGELERAAAWAVGVVEAAQ